MSLAGGVYRATLARLDRAPRPALPRRTQSSHSYRLTIVSAYPDRAFHRPGQGLPEPPVSRSAPPSQRGDLRTANMSGEKQSRASTKRAQLIGMLERPEGASVAEIGQRLGWLPHTVRAAFTGLRHAGREVTRSKDAAGRTVYRLARA
jgi:uncharacterized protein DUF3489